jgi:hypothetical protein
MASASDPVDYTAQASSPIVNGEVKIKINEHSFVATSPFDVADIQYVRINSIGLDDYVTTVRTDDGDFVFRKMGQYTQAFFDNICEAYNKAVLRAFFVTGKPNLKASGDYRFADSGGNVNGSKAPVHVYEDCIVGLPPNGNSRRIPLCFATGMDKGQFDLTLNVSNISGGSDSYTFARLGNDSDAFAQTVDKNLRAIRDKTLAAIKEFDTSLSAAQYSQLVKLIPEGMAAPMGQIASIAPSFASAIESKIAKTRGGESYKAFKEMVDPAKIWVGFRKGNFREEGTAVGPDDGQPESDDPVVQSFLFWMIVPSPCGRYATVEFAEAGTATFIYRTDGDFSRTAMSLNRALEATSFKREVIRLTDEELLKPENADYYMAAKRTASLQYIRRNFAKRLIHTDTWKNRLLEAWKD